MIRQNLIIGAIVVVFVATLPLLALMLFTLRAVVLLAIIAAAGYGLVAYAVRPAFREWFKAHLQRPSDLS